MLRLPTYSNTLIAELAGRGVILHPQGKHLWQWRRSSAPRKDNSQLIRKRTPDITNDTHASHTHQLARNS
jgi:disulfide oxidoreductase YuzD